MRTYRHLSLVLLLTASVPGAWASVADSDHYSLLAVAGEPAASGLLAGANYRLQAGAVGAFAGINGLSRTVPPFSGAGDSAPTAPTTVDLPGSNVDLPAGATAVLSVAATINAGAGSIVTIAAGSASSGAAIKLATVAPVGSANGQSATVTINIGGQSLAVTPTVANTVLGVRTVTINGVASQVLTLSAGAVTVAASQANQALFSVAGASGVVTAVSAGTIANSRYDLSSGETRIAVSSGTLLLPASGAANGFAATAERLLHAGEMAVFDGQGRLSSMRLGGAPGTVGEPLGQSEIVGLTRSASIPSLLGKPARLAGGQRLDQAVAEVIGAAVGGKVSSSGQDDNGAVRFAIGGDSLVALPLGSIDIDTSRADGLSLLANGQVRIASGGLLSTWGPALAEPLALLAALRSIDAGASLELSADGFWLLHLAGASYAVQPAWQVAQAAGGQGGWTVDSQGDWHVVGKPGQQQALYPALLESPRLLQLLHEIDAAASLLNNGDGSYRLDLAGRQYRIRPDYQLSAVPAGHADDSWWLGDGRLYWRSADGKRMQGLLLQ